MAWLASFIAGFLIIRFLVVILNTFTFPALKIKSNRQNSFLVSILIPARNEQKNLPVLLTNLRNQDYKNIEVIVYDDQSSDKTPEIAEKFSKLDSRFSWIKGEDLPVGWIGKSFGCHLLAKKANGKFFMFIDADVQVGPGLISSAIHYFDSKHLKLLSIFPDQKMLSAGEKSTVPVMHWILLTLLPLILIRKSRLVSFSAANGQFMLFDALNYNRYHYHELVKNHPVEDIMIMKVMKKLGFRTATLLGNNQIICRMYHGYKDALQGFSRNIVDFFGGSIFILVLYNFVTTFGLVIIAIGWNIYFSIAYLIILLTMRIFVSWLGKQSIIGNILYMLPVQISQLAISFLSIRNRMRGLILWKGRKIKI